MTLADGTSYPLKGKMNFADRQVDPSTGALTLEAQFKNTDNLLRPGQYVKLKLVTEFGKMLCLFLSGQLMKCRDCSRSLQLLTAIKLNLKLIKIGPTVQYELYC